MQQLCGADPRSEVASCSGHVCLGPQGGDPEVQLGGSTFREAPCITKPYKTSQAATEHPPYLLLDPKRFRGDCEVKGEKVVEPTAMLSVGAYEIMF